jgi:paraquat-inducible protein B
MDIDAGNGSGPPGSPRIVVARRPRVPLVWTIPIVAALVAAFLAWQTWSQMGPTITIVFEHASGLEEGKTPIKYRDVSLGVVKTVRLSPDLSHVIVTAQMDEDAEDHLTEGTKFWIESARLSASGVSGLSTLVSGVYVGMLPGPGKAARRFDGQANPPVLTMNVPGRTFHLHADRLGSLSAGTSLYYRGIAVGEVLGYDLDASGRGVTIFAFVRAPHDTWVKPETHFWNASGIDVSLGASGVKVRTEGLVSVLLGGIAFDTPDSAASAIPSPAGASFPLFDSHEAIAEGQYTERIPFLARFEGSVEGLLPGAPVLMRGLQIGVVKSVSLEIDLDTSEVEIPVVFEIQPQRASLRGKLSESPGRERAAAMVKHGLRAQLQSGNLLTGSLLIGLEFFPDAPKAELVFEGELPVIPTVPSDIQELKQEATKFVQNLAKAPIGQLVTDLRNGVQTIDRLLASKKVQEGVPEMVDNVNATLAAARGALEKAEVLIGDAGDAIGPDSALRYELGRMIAELTRTARSLRVLADFLERDPNALIFGKGTAP